jgi:hypothetical protein
MKTKLSHLSVLVLAAVCFVLNGAAQQNDRNAMLRSAVSDKYVISAKAGAVNYVEGTVTVARTQGKGGVLLKGDKLDIGDKVTTSANGRAEILLNPGSFLRINGDSAFSFKTTSLDDLQLVLDRGSAILEVFAADDFRVTVGTPRNSYSLIQSGVYRIDVPAEGTSTIEVWKGRAEVGDTVVKSGRMATGVDANVAVAKFDRDEKDAFELWSKSRAKDLAKLNSSLERRDLRTVLMQSFLGRRWNVYNSFGLWVYDPFSFSYCFLPFGYGWSSPYGYGFGRDLGWYGLPSVVYYPPAVTNPNAGGGSGGATSNGVIASQGGRDGTPPFIRMQGGNGIGRGSSGSSASDSFDPPSIRSSGNISAPPVSMPSAAPSAPMGNPKKDH